MKLQLYVSNAEYKDNNQMSSDSLCEKLSVIPFIQNISYAQNYNKNPVKIKSGALMISNLIQKRRGIFLFYDQNLKNSEFILTCSAFKNYINFILEFDCKNEGDLLRKLQDLKFFFVKFYSATAEYIQIGLVTSIRLPEAEYKLPTPHFFWRFYDRNALVDIIFDEPVIEFDDMKKITKALQINLLPNGVIRFKIDKLLIIDWSLSISNSNCKDVLRLRAKWFQDNGNFIIDSSYNNEGDSLFVTINLVRDTYFTFIDTFTGNAFKGILVPNEESQVDTLLKEIINHKKDCVKQVYIIVPNRTAAIGISSKCKNIGITAALYSDNSGQLWLVNN